MYTRPLFLIMIALFFSVSLKAQITIAVNVDQGCDSLLVNFHLEPSSALDTITSVSWDFGNGEPASNLMQPFATYLSEGTYTVSCLINGTNLVTSADLIHVFKSPCALNNLKVQNVFTPDYDGINDFFIVRTNELFNYSFSVYSRTGILVYKSEAPTIRWDGRNLSGQELNTGIYYFVIKQLDGRSKLEKTGFVYIFR